MRTVSGEELKWIPYPGQRAMVTEMQPLLQGSPDAPDNYEMYMIRYGEGGSHSPRHRHNFEQFRWAFDQPLNYGPGEDIPPGCLAYFPEGAYYGPQTNHHGSVMLIVQFGGASGEGYMDIGKLQRGTQALRAKGEFSRGVFTWSDASGKKHNQDAYEAVWEQVRGRPLRYPRPRYNATVLIDPQAFAWLPVRGAPGVERRQFGVFNERGTSAGQVRLARGTHHVWAAQDGEQLIFVLGGRMEVAGMALAVSSSISLAPGEAGECLALDDTTLLYFTMPDFSELTGSGTTRSNAMNAKSVNAG